MLEVITSVLLKKQEADIVENLFSQQPINLDIFQCMEYFNLPEKHDNT